MNNQTRKRLKRNKALDFEIDFFEALIKDKPDFVDALIPLGDCYTKKGLYEKGLYIDLRLTKLLPQDPVVHYNLACSYSLLGIIDEAIQSLENAIKLGYNDFEYIDKDKDLENVKNDDRYLNLLKMRHKVA
jgi:tetratricopeptide (TPR) repeat protein